MTQRVSRLLCMFVAITVLFFSVPFSTSAAVSSRLISCGTFNSNNEIQVSGPGIPVISGGTPYVLTSESLYLGEEMTCYAVADEELVEMKPANAFSGVVIWEATQIPENLCYQDAYPIMGETVTLLAETQKHDIETYSITIIGAKPTDNSTFALEVNVDESISNSEAFLPGVLLNNNNKLVGFASGEGFFSFGEPTSGGGNNPPVEKGGDTTSKGPQRSNPGDESGSGDAPNPQMKKLIIIGGGLAVGLLIGMILKKQSPKKKETQMTSSASASNNDYIPPVPPIKPVDFSATKPEDKNEREHSEPEVKSVDGWEDVPAEKKGVQISIIGVGGQLNGLTYPVGQKNILIGRAEEATIRYTADTKGVSRKHCKVFWHNGGLMVMDLGSTSGTFLRGKGQIPTNTPVPISAGDVIYLGSKQNGLRIAAK